MKKIALMILFFFLAAALLSFKIFNNRKRPNIIILGIDTLRADHLSCYGYEKNTSPYLDLFVKDSVIFKKAISQAPTTTPAFMSIFTALTPAVHGVGNMTLANKDGEYNRLNEKIKTMAGVLKENGYLTIGLHGGGNLREGLGFEKGFDQYSLLDIQNKIFFPSKILTAIKHSKDSGKPLFLFVHHYLCHDPYLKAPKKIALQFLDQKVDGFPVCWNDISGSNDFFEQRNNFWEDVDLSNPKHKEHIISLYDAGVYYSDQFFKELIETLKKEAYYDNSIIIVLADHGEEFYEHQDKLHWRLYIETLHVPFIIKFPKNEYAGSVIDKQIRTFDLMPTLFDFLNIKSDNFMQGISLLPLVVGKSSYSPLMISYFEDNKHIRIANEEFVYRNQRRQKKTLVNEMLFDLKNDSRETNNLAEVKSDITEKMRKLSKNVLDEDRALKNNLGYDSEIVIKKDETVLKELRALGYVQ